MENAAPARKRLALSSPFRRLRIRPVTILFCLILLLGIFARVWEFPDLPPSLYADEVSTGVDAFSLYRYGLDRNGVSFPIHFISWGGGQNALYAYLLIPFLALGGLTPFTVRLPMLLSGILTLPLVYWIARRLAGEGFAGKPRAGKPISPETFALLAMFLLAISPWHIMLSRWALESNILPFAFSLGFLCLLKSRRENRWFILAGLFFGLCLYAYGTAYAALPVFLAGAVSVLIGWKRASLKDVAFGLGVFILLALPIGLFIYVNATTLPTLQIGPISIPHLPTRPRYTIVSVLFSDHFVPQVLQNLKDLWTLLWKQADGLAWNTVPPYGYFYRFTLPLAIFGAFLLVPRQRRAPAPERLWLLLWLAVGLLLGLLQSPNINRVNLIFIPLILCVAACLAWIGARLHLVLVALAAVFLVAFALFSRDYHSPAYRARVGAEFADGLLPALAYARQAGAGPICITKDANMPYVYALFADPQDPRAHLPTLVYINPGVNFREVRTLGRYGFGTNNCPNDPRTIYILAGETPPDESIPYQVVDFNNFHVYIPQP